MSEIVETREFPGLTTEVATIILHDGKTLIGRRKSTGLWEVPNDSVHIMESFKDTAIRDVFERAGINVEPQSVIFVSEVINPEGQSHRIVIFLYANYVSGEISIRDENPLWDEVEWVDVRELSKYQPEMDDLTVDGFYKFSMVLKQSAGRQA